MKTGSQREKQPFTEVPEIKCPKCGGNGALIGEHTEGFHLQKGAHMFMWCNSCRRAFWFVAPEAGYFDIEAVN
jgi:hypothetical protein